MRLPIFNRHPRAELSAFIDGELIPLRVEAMQFHLESCQSCRTEVAELRRLKADLAALPEMPAPRSFALTAQMAEPTAHEQPRAYVPPRAAALANGMRLAGAAMTLALAIVLVLDFTGSGTTDGGDKATAARVQLVESAHDTGTVYEFNSAPAQAAANSGVPILTPTPTSAPGATSAPGGVLTGPSSNDSLGGASGNNPSTQAVSPPSNGTPGPAIATAEAPAPGVAQTDTTPPSEKATNGTIQDSLATSVPAALNLPLSSGSPEGPQSATGSGGGVGTLLLVALALAAGVVLTVAGSFLLRRLGREDL